MVRITKQNISSWFRGSAWNQKYQERITVLLTCSLVGKKLVPWVIAKLENPRCFKNINKTKLSFKYRANKQPWMNAMIFQEYIQYFNEEMRKQNRKVLLDNATSHCKLNLSHVTIKFYPPNCTSKLQPLDQGIIKTFKGYYKNLLVNKLIDEIDYPKTNKANIYDAISWIHSAWKKVLPETIVNCFIRAGHEKMDEFKDESCEKETCMPVSELADLLQTRIEFSKININELLNFDNDIPTEENLNSENWEQ